MLIIGSTCNASLEMMWPYATTTPRYLFASLALFARFLVTSAIASATSCETGSCSSCAVSLTGLGEVCEPRPLRLSIPVTTRSTTKPAATSALSGPTAISGVPKKMTRSVGPFGNAAMDFTSIASAPVRWFSVALLDVDIRLTRVCADRESCGQTSEPH